MDRRNGSPSRRPRRGPATRATAAAAGVAGGVLAAAILSGCGQTTGASAQTTMTGAPSPPAEGTATTFGSTVTPFGATPTGTATSSPSPWATQSPTGTGVSPSPTASATVSPTGPTSGPLAASPAPFTLPNGVTGATGVASNGKILAMGGQDQAGHATNQVTSIDPNTNQATPAGTLATPVTNAAGAAVGATPTVFGGNTRGANDPGGVTDTVQTYANGTSQQVGRLPAPRENLGATTANGKTYLAGGDDGRTPQGDIWSTTDGKTFQTAGKLDTPVRNPAVATTGTGNNQKVTVFGGQAANGPTDAIQQFDPATGQTRTVGHLPADLKDASTFNVNGTTYLAGGQTKGQAQPKVYKFDPNTNTVSDAGVLPDGVENAAAAATGNKAYLMGGEVKNKVTNGVTQLQPR